MSVRTGRGRPAETWPVKVLMRRTHTHQTGSPAWDLLALLPDPRPPARRTREPVHEAPGQLDVQWSGLAIPLFRDAAESYWFNLVGRAPRLFAICRPGADLEPEPFAVSADEDEAGTYLETDELVFGAPLPAILAPRLEAFVATHYRPTPPRKRAKGDWAEDADDDKRARKRRTD